jgi:hypothetical protein
VLSSKRQLNVQEEIENILRVRECTRSNIRAKHSSDRNRLRWLNVLRVKFPKIDSGFCKNVMRLAAISKARCTVFIGVAMSERLPVRYSILACWRGTLPR